MGRGGVSGKERTSLISQRSGEHAPQIIAFQERKGAEYDTFREMDGSHPKRHFPETLVVPSFVE